MSKPLNIGLTGGIGAGKSVCAAIFNELGVPIYNSDVEAKRLMNSNTDLIQAIKELFGNEAYTEDGQLNRPYISNIIFQNEKMLSQMNAIVHPAVRANANSWLESHADKVYVIQESAILFETGAYKLFDKMIVVTAPEELRIERTMKRDHVSRENVLSRLKNQMTENDKLDFADFIIQNDGLQGLVQQIIEIHIDLQNYATLKKLRDGQIAD